MRKIRGHSRWLAPVAFVLAAGTMQASGVSTTLVVPIVLSSQGLGGSFNVSEMTLTNRGTTDAAVTYSYTAAFGGGGGTATDILPAGRQQIVPDALAYLRSLNASVVPESGDRGGTLRVVFSGLAADGDAAITVRTTSPSGNGRAGVAYKGIPTSRLLTGTAYLCGLRQDGNDRSNVAVLNAGTTSDGNVTLRLTVISGDTASPGRYPLSDITLAPGGFQQLSGILEMAGTGASSANVAYGYVQIERVGGTASYWAYAVINDQVTSDGSIVSPVTTSTYSGVSKLIVPVIVETASYASELMLANIGATAKSLQFTYVAGALSGGSATFTVDLSPYEQKIIPDLVSYLRGNGTPGVGPSGPDVVGTLFANVVEGDAAGLLLGAKTSTRGPHRYGVFYEGKAKGSGAVSEAWLYGLQQNEETRTNLALVNTSDSGGAAETLRVELFDGETGVKVATVEGDATTVAARGFQQLGSILGTYAPGITNGYARITRTVGNGPFLAYAVVNDGGRPGERTGDGAFVEESEDGIPAADSHGRTFVMIHLEAGYRACIQGDLPAGFVIPEEYRTRPLGYQEYLWPTVVELVQKADEFDFKLTLALNPQWAEFVLKDSEKVDAVRRWQESGHEVAFHHHGLNHVDWNGYSNRPEAQKDGAYLGAVDDGYRLVEALAAPYPVSSGTLSDLPADLPSRMDRPDADIIFVEGNASDSYPQLGPVKSLRPTRDPKPNGGFRVHFTIRAYSTVTSLSLDEAFPILEAQYMRMGEDEVFGIVWHDFDYFRSRDKYVEWFRFIQGQGDKVRSVGAINEFRFGRH